MPKPHPRPAFTSESQWMGLKHLKAPQLIPSAAKVENHCFIKACVVKEKNTFFSKSEKELLIKSKERRNINRAKLMIWGKKYNRED